MMYDETPDKAKRKQMSQVLRYLHIDWDAKTVKIKESFLGFIETFGKDAVSIVNFITSQLGKDGIRWRTVDHNAMTMLPLCWGTCPVYKHEY